MVTTISIRAFCRGFCARFESSSLLRAQAHAQDITSLHIFKGGTACHRHNLDYYTSPIVAWMKMVGRHAVATELFLEVVKPSKVLDADQAV